MTAAFITGLSGPSLTAAEAAFLRNARPAGLILFARNIESPGQVRRLIADARAAMSGDALVLVDQEGGRVQRLRPPHWRALPSGAQYAARAASVGLPAAALDTHAVARLIADDLTILGFNCNCTPVLDVLAPGAHANIGNRALGTTAETVIALGRAVAEGQMAAGVLPVMKHVPGHGRATLDTHLALPTVSTSRDELSRSDFAPFKALSHLPAAMTAHVVFSAIDANLPASVSRTVTQHIIRGEIGFDGLLMSDDLSMHALSGDIGERARAVLAAGSDLVLHCNGIMAEMEVVAAAVPALAAHAAERFARAFAVTRQRAPFDLAQAELSLARILASAVA